MLLLLTIKSNPKQPSCKKECCPQKGYGGCDGRLMVKKINNDNSGEFCAKMASPFFIALLFLISYHFYLYLCTHLFFFFTTGSRKELKDCNTSTIFDFLSNYINFIHIFITCQLFPSGYFFATDLSVGDLKCS